MKGIFTPDKTVRANFLVSRIVSSVLSGVCLFEAAAGQFREAAEPKWELCRAGITPGRDPLADLLRVLAQQLPVLWCWAAGRGDHWQLLW